MSTNNKNEATGWEQTNNQLYQTFTFKNFNEAFGFMTRVALVAEKMDHHPTWTNSWNKVEIWLQTHSADNTITAKDYTLAQEINKLV